MKAATIKLQRLLGNKLTIQCFTAKRSEMASSFLHHLCWLVFQQLSKETWCCFQLIWSESHQTAACAWGTHAEWLKLGGALNFYRHYLIPKASEAKVSLGTMSTVVDSELQRSVSWLPTRWSLKSSFTNVRISCFSQPFSCGNISERMVHLKQWLTVAHLQSWFVTSWQSLFASLGPVDISVWLDRIRLTCRLLISPLLHAWSPVRGWSTRLRVITEPTSTRLRSLFSLCSLIHIC